MVIIKETETSRRFLWHKDVWGNLPTPVPLTDTVGGNQTPVIYQDPVPLVLIEASVSVAEQTSQDGLVTESQ